MFDTNARIKTPARLLTVWPCLSGVCSLRSSQVFWLVELMNLKNLPAPCFSAVEVLAPHAGSEFPFESTLIAQSRRRKGAESREGGRSANNTEDDFQPFLQSLIFTTNESSEQYFQTPTTPFTHQPLLRFSGHFLNWHENTAEGNSQHREALLFLQLQPRQMLGLSVHLFGTDSEILVCFVQLRSLTLLCLMTFPLSFLSTRGCFSPEILRIIGFYFSVLKFETTESPFIGIFFPFYKMQSWFSSLSYQQKSRFW